MEQSFLRSHSPRTLRNSPRYATYCEQDSLVSMVSGYELDDWAIKVLSPAEAKGFFL
jgi:hypothetical protein